jgi:hypothetical protein
MIQGGRVPGVRRRVPAGTLAARLLGALPGSATLAPGPHTVPVPPGLASTPAPGAEAPAPSAPPPVATAPALLVPPPAQAVALEVTGIVRDAATGLPVGAARVRLESEGADPPEHETLTGADGRFRFPVVEPGPWALRVEALGFQLLQAPVLVQGAPPFEIQVGLVPDALVLDPVVVTAARSPRLYQVGFYDRRMRGGGGFLDRNDFEARPGITRLTDHLVRFPGVTLVPAGVGSRSRIALRGGCAPDIVLDGMNLGPRVAVDDLAWPDALEGVEVHRVATLPPALSGNTCGAVLLWSRDPGRLGEGRPFSFRRVVVAVVLTVAALLALR